jgi:hypothetical protein
MRMLEKLRAVGFVEHLNSRTIGRSGWLRFNREGGHK